MLISWVVLVGLFCAAFSKRTVDHYKQMLGVLGATVVSMLTIVAFYVMELTGMLGQRTRLLSLFPTKRLQCTSRHLSVSSSSIANRAL